MIKVLLLEGVDGVGKSTFIKFINKKSNYKFICIDRFFGSAVVYDTLYDRENRIIDIINAEKELFNCSKDNIKFYVIYLHAPVEVLIKRLKEKNEDPEIVRRIKDSIKLYDVYCKLTKFPVIKLDTSTLTLDGMYSIILDNCER